MSNTKFCSKSVRKMKLFNDSCFLSSYVDTTTWGNEPNFSGVKDGKIFIFPIILKNIRTLDLGSTECASSYNVLAESLEKLFTDEAS